MVCVGGAAAVAAGKRFSTVCKANDENLEGPDDVVLARFQRGI
jgi:hypothetical protein